MKIAIVKLSAMGDIIHAMVVLQFIKKANPALEIDWIVEESFREVLEGNPDIDAIHTVNLKSIKKKFSRLFGEIRKVRTYAENHYDLVIDMQGLLKSAILSKLLCSKKNGCKVSGFDKDSIRESAASYLYDETATISYRENKIYRNAYLASTVLGVDITAKELDQKDPFLFSAPKSFSILSEKKKNILLVVGSSWENKNYPKEKYLELTKRFDAHYIVCWGNEEEHLAAKFLTRNSDGNCVAAPKLSLEELKSLVSQVDAVVGNDTGPTHMAWALNVPSVMIFGPTPIQQAYITDINKVVKSGSEVDPCKLDRNDMSIKDIDEEQIISVIKELLHV